MFYRDFLRKHRPPLRHSRTPSADCKSPRKPSSKCCQVLRSLDAARNRRLGRLDRTRGARRLSGKCCCPATSPAHRLSCSKNLPRNWTCSGAAIRSNSCWNSNSRLYEAFDYAPNSTEVDSPIDDALRIRQGVCQDFAHIMIALVRQLGIPCRYVSGYLYHDRQTMDRSPAGASHAWVEAYLGEPGLGRLRSHQQSHRLRPPHPRRRRPRLLPTSRRPAASTKAKRRAN